MSANDRRSLILFALCAVYAPTIVGLLLALAIVTGPGSAATLLGAALVVPGCVAGVSLMKRQLDGQLSGGAR